MPPRPDNAARTHRPRGPSGVARGCEALPYPEKRRVFRMILAHYLLRVDGKQDPDYSATMRDRSCLIRPWVASTIPRMMSAAGWIALTRPTDCPARRLIDSMSPVVWAFGGRLANC